MESTFHFLKSRNKAVSKSIPKVYWFFLSTEQFCHFCRVRVLSKRRWIKKLFRHSKLSFQNHSIFLRTALLVRNLLLKSSSNGGSLQKTCLGIPTRKSRLIAFSVTNAYAFVMTTRVGSKNQRARRFSHFLIHLKSLRCLENLSEYVNELHENSNSSHSRLFHHGKSWITMDWTLT